MSIFKYTPPKYLMLSGAAGRKLFAFLHLKVKQPSTHGFATAGCFDAVSPVSTVTPKFRGPQLRIKMLLLAEPGRGFVAGHRTWFSARQRFHQRWIGAAERQGVMACSGGHRREALPGLTLSLSHLGCISAGSLVTLCYVIQAHVVEIPYVTPSTRKSQALQFTVCTNDLFVFRMVDLILTGLKTLFMITEVGQ